MEQNDINNLNNQQQDTNNVEWYFVNNNNKQKQGPYTEKQMIDGYNSRHILPNTYVICTGMREWIPFSQSSLSMVCNDGLPEVPLDCVKSTWAWCLAGVQVVAIILAIMGINVPAWGYWIANSVFTILDMGEIYKVRKGLGIWAIWGFVIVPIYLFVRASKVDKKYGYAITFLVAFIIQILVTGSMSLAQSNSNSTPKLNLDSVTSDAVTDEYLEDLQEATFIGNKVTTVGINEEFSNKTIKGMVIDTDLDYQDYNSLWTEVPDGYKVIFIKIKVTNISDESNYVSVGDFKCYADDIDVDAELVAGGNEDYNENIQPGRSAILGAEYVIPSNTSSIELEYCPIGESADRIVIKIQ